MRLKVMYIDDEKEICDNFSNTFSSDRIVVTTFTDPHEAIAAAALQPPDVVFVDYQLRTTTGDKVVKAMKEDIPKFLITGDILAVAKTPGFVKVFSKPCKEEEILRVLTEYNSK